jgi:hypothetical protein
VRKKRLLQSDIIKKLMMSSVKNLQENFIWDYLSIGKKSDNFLKGLKIRLLSNIQIREKNW